MSWISFKDLMCCVDVLKSRLHVLAAPLLQFLFRLTVHAIFERDTAISTMWHVCDAKTRVRLGFRQSGKSTVR